MQNLTVSEIIPEAWPGWEAPLWGNLLVGTHPFLRGILFGRWNWIAMKVVILALPIIRTAGAIYSIQLAVN